MRSPQLQVSSRSAFVPSLPTLLSMRSPSLSRRRRPGPTMCLPSPTPAPTHPVRVSRAVVWFREADLRLQDHPGLEAATAHTSTALAPLLVVTPTTRHTTLAAAARLHRDLVARGSTLFLRYAADGEAAAVIDFLTAFDAQRVHVHLDVEAEARAVVSAVAHALDGVVAVHTWATDLRDWQTVPVALPPLPRDFPAYRAWRARARVPVLPSAAEFEPQRIVPPPGDMPEALVGDAPFPLEVVTEQLRKAPAVPDWESAFDERATAERKLTRAHTPPVDSDGFGEAALVDFLQRAERDEAPDLGRSLGEVFRQGALSPGRIFEIVHDFERGNGRIWPCVYREAAKLMLGFLDAREFATLLARNDISSCATVDGIHRPRFWRWNGFLVRYVEEGADTKWAKRGAPALVLVHGFGASSQHFGKSIAILKRDYHVFALDLLGFGQSEKPPTQYTSATWESLLWDFVREVVGRPVYVAGNSIGGQISCAFGVDAYQKLCTGICLINSAGRLTDRDNSSEASPSGAMGLARYAVRKWRWVRLLAARTLLRQLQGRIDTTLQKVYPKHGIEVGGELAQEIKRASLDFGAVEVLCSGLIIPSQRSLSELLSAYDGPLLIFNGLLDPLGDVPRRTDRLAEIYPKASVVRVDAGHCPHDEEPELFAEALSEWVLQCESQSDDRTLVVSKLADPDYEQKAPAV